MSFDVLTFGRVSIDLYSKNIGAEFNDIKELTTSIGGSPTNIAVGAKRLGLKTGLFSAVGPDPTGGFILNTLKNEGVDIVHVQTIKDTTSTAVICGIIPPDRFPLIFYRDNAPDEKITIDHVEKIDFSIYKSFLMSGTALAVEPARSAALYATEKAKKVAIPVILDIDFRAISWKDIRTHGIVLRQYLTQCNIVIGTEEELLSVFIEDANQLSIKENAITNPTITGNVNEAIAKVMDFGVDLLLVKTGADGMVAYHKDGTVEKVPGFKVEPVNILGAGDSFAAGFLYGYINGWDTYKSCRLANACGAWMVTKQGCCNFAPYYNEIIEFIESKGGF
ncbi:MAG: 5-dehydro-2-deoxygluconokinase [Nonlabens sp.]|jgi:5-dehydro-2-deoxygluconokinase